MLKQKASTWESAKRLDRKEGMEPGIADRSFDSLLELKEQIDAEIERRKAAEIEALRAQITEKAQTLGISLHELLGPAAQNGKRLTRHSRGKQPAKYRGPNGEEWSGRGPSPRWMKPFLAKGRSKADFLIGDSK